MSNPLAWTDDGCADVSTHLSNAKSVAGTLMAIDGRNDLDALSEGAVCTLMIMLDQEIDAAIEIFEQGGVK